MRLEELSLHRSAFLGCFPEWTQEVDSRTPYNIDLYLPIYQPAEWLNMLLAELHSQLGKLGFAPFHGALIRTQGKILIISGRSGAGKSLFTQLIGTKFEMLCDDMFFARFLDETGEFNVIPIPKLMRSRSKLIESGLKSPVRAQDLRFKPSEIRLLFPEYSASYGLTEIAHADHAFQRTLAGNLYGDAKKSTRNILQQMNCRRKICSHAKSFKISYNDEVIAQEVPSLFAALEI